MRGDSVVRASLLALDELRAIVRVVQRLGDRATLLRFDGCCG